MKTTEHINTLHSGLPRFLIESAFWMMVRILVVNLVPVFFVVTGLTEYKWGLILMDVITISADIWYAWVLRRVLV